MGFYSRWVFPRVLDLVMQQKQMIPFRERIGKAASGRVLDVGIGSGLNLPFYGNQIDRLVGIDPSPELLRFAEERARETSNSVELLRGSGEALPIEDHSIDTAVVTFTLCSVDNAIATLAEIRRVLRPNGILLFAEHGRAPEAGVAWWQDRLTPVWSHIAGGCHLNRKPDDLIRSAGFRIDGLETGYVRGPRPMTSSTRAALAQSDLAKEVYADEAVSGASLHGRDALIRMIGDAERGSFDVISVEHIDRLARNAADTIRLREQTEFIGIEIHTCASGLVTEMHAGLEGLMSAMYLKQLAVHVRRGQAGRVREGLSGGGITYGYAPVPGKRGERTIVEAEATIVRRIFTEYRGGRTPRAIAIDLNRERISAPRGDFWSATAIVGNRKRGSGLLSNALYDGRLVWNKVSMRKDPRMGKRVSHINPESSWRVTSAPHLRIIDADGFAAVQARLDERGHEWPTAPRKPRHLLSGLLRCGCCGRSLVVKDRDSKGRRICCTRMREGCGCANTRAFYLMRLSVGCSLAWSPN